MPPRRRACTERAQDDDEPEEDTQQQIHGHLDLGSLAALGQTSFACLDEVSAALYRDVVVASEKALISLASGTSARRSARLDRLLSLAQVRTLKILVRIPINDFVGSLLWKGDNPRPRRLAATSTPLALDRVVVAAGSLHPSIGLDTLLLFIFPFLNPIHVDFWSCATLFEARYCHVPAPGPLGGWSNVLRGWSSLRSVTIVGWNPLFSPKGRSILHACAWIAGGGSFELELDQRMAPFDPSHVHEWLKAIGALGASLTGLKTKLFVGPKWTQLAKKRLQKLTVEQQGRFELVASSSS